MDDTISVSKKFLDKMYSNKKIKYILRKLPYLCGKYYIEHSNLRIEIVGCNKIDLPLSETRIKKLFKLPKEEWGTEKEELLNFYKEYLEENKHAYLIEFKIFDI